ncbi:hypothetical protein DAPPUDRAFT_237405 [Daphnia pulex]|uniref:Amino acid permease/ SLC12A domain-containing protein n=1 Tax=Daphnia pulex TaxID=6669 RepID=E9G3U6_DAPPU|nr:hypothetical protein DAPPUDRAFT_237405 [Daphnia pulex]|eukprot:EFX85835.1 hypothetical protein DAPPUDRAFT_237405 [Daphnia pulex]
MTILQTTDSDSVRQRTSQEDNNTNVELKLKKDDGNISTDKINDIKSSDRMPSDNKDEMRMARQVGLFSAVALVIGNIIGSGIFVSPGYLLASAGSPGLCLVLWGVCGVYSLLGIIAFVNCYSVTAATRVQNIFTVAKLAAIAIVIGGGLYYLCLGYTENLEIGFEGSATSFGQIATAFYGGLWAYSGWNNLNYITEEIQNPYRNLPFAIIIALPLTTILYVLINVSYFTVLTPQEIITSDAVAVDWGIEVLGPASFLIPLGVVMSIFGATNGTSLLATIMIIPGDIASLIDFFGFTISMFYCAAMVALIVMRFTKKDEHRPIKVPIIIPIIVMVISAILVVAPIAVEPQVHLQYFYKNF